MNTAVNNMLFTSSNMALRNVDTSYEFIAGILVGVLLTFLCIGLVKLIFIVFVE